MPGLFCRKPAALLVLVLLSAPVKFLQSQSNSDPPSVAPPGEILRYRIEWRLVHAGDAKLTWSTVGSSGEGSWQTGLLVESAGLVSKLYKVEDKYFSSLNDRLCAGNATLTAHEGSRYRETRITFDAERRKASYLEKDLAKNTVIKRDEIDIPACVYDVVGGLYRLRTMRVPVGTAIQLPVSNGKKSAAARVEAQGREEVKTPAGVFQTVRYEAFLFNDVIYQREGRAFVWITNDNRRLPVQIRVRLPFPVGTVTLLLEKVEHS